MKVSVVTISYNQDKYLAQAIRSVLTQRRAGVEVEYIVVDPGSTDGSRALIEAFGDEIQVKLFEEDSGPADGLRKGFEHATGDVFCYLNADDFFLPGAFARAVHHLGRTGADVLLGDGFITYEDHRRDQLAAANRFSARKYAAGAAVFLQQASFFRANAYRGVGGFNASNGTCWDGELLVEMALHGFRFTNLHEQLAVFRIHGESISGTGRLEQEYQRDQERLRERVIREQSPLSPLGVRLLRASGRGERVMRRMWQRVVQGRSLDSA